MDQPDHASSTALGKEQLISTTGSDLLCISRDWAPSQTKESFNRTQAWEGRARIIQNRARGLNSRAPHSLWNSRQPYRGGGTVIAPGDRLRRDVRSATSVFAFDRDHFFRITGIMLTRATVFFSMRDTALSDRRWGRRLRCVCREGRFLPTGWALTRFVLNAGSLLPGYAGGYPIGAVERASAADNSVRQWSRSTPTVSFGIPRG